MISARTKLNFIIGNPIAHSLTPVLHNAAYSQLGIDHEFVMLAAPVLNDHLERAVSGFRAIGVNALTITTPHKETILPFLDELDEDAKLIRAVNTVVNVNGKLVGSNTDWVGITESLAAKTDLTSAKVIVVGAGGASRAAVFGLMRAGAEVTVMNRTHEKAVQIGKDLGASVLEFKSGVDIKFFDVIVNCTTLGMDAHAGSPLPIESLKPDHIVFETIYFPRRTRLVEDATSVGAVVIPGVMMFFNQAVAQIERQVGKRPCKEELYRVYEALLAP